MDRDAAEPNEVLERLLELARCNFKQREEFRAHETRAIELLQIALRRPGVREPAAYALSRLRNELAELALRRTAALAAETVAELELEPELTQEDVDRIRSTFKLPSEAIAALESCTTPRAA